MAASSQVAVGTATPALLASAAASAGAGPVGWFYLTNGGAAIYLGGPNVSASNGAQVPAGATLSGWLFSGDQIWAVTASGSSTVGVLVTGA